MKGAKRVFLFIIVFCLVMPIAFSAVEIKDIVNDYANILTAEQEQEITNILRQIHESGEAQVAVVIIDSLEGKSIESYSLELAQGNLGDKEKNNGLLLLVAVEDRKYRFEVGRGIEHILNDAKVGRIGRTYLVQNFQNNDYANGILEASLAIRSIFLGDVESEYYVTGEEVDYQTYQSIFTFAFFILFFFVFPLLGSLFYKKHKSNNRYFNAAMGAVILFGGRGGRGGGGGGFGGFGGGGFGGGGSSGGW